MKKRWIYLILPVITIILEILPYGAVCNFANPEGEPWHRTFSYFDLLPFGYANFAPFITALLTCLVVFLLLIYFFTGKKALALFTKYILCFCAPISLGPLIFGINFFSVTGLLITVTLIAQILLLHFMVKKDKKHFV